MKHRMIYHVYIPNTCDFPEIYKLHFACIKEYASIFDDTIFVLSIDDIDNRKLIRKYQDIILDANFKGNLTFAIEQNDKNLREAKTFKKYIVDDIIPYEGLTFFAHSKGLTNKYTDNLKDWIAAMYFGCLGDVNLVDKYFSNQYKCLF